MMDIVDHTLKEWRRTPFVYGQSDCMLSLAHYFIALGGEDITKKFVGRYNDETGARNVMSDAGGFAAIMADAGAIHVGGHPKRGDMVCILTADGDEIGALCTGDMVAARLQRGVAEVPVKFARISGVWRVRS